MDSLPFANVTENIMLNDQKNNYKKAQHLYCTNNDMLANIDPDINNMNPNGLTKQCKFYDASLEFNKTVVLNKIYQFYIQTYVAQLINQMTSYTILII